MERSDDLIIIQMQDGCNSARSEAIKRIKDNTVKYLAAGRTPIAVNEAQVRHKTLRGLNDRAIGRLLIPADDLHEWDMDPDAYVHLPHTILNLSLIAHVHDTGPELTIYLGCSPFGGRPCLRSYTRIIRTITKTPRKVFSEEPSSSA